MARDDELEGAAIHRKIWRDFKGAWDEGGYAKFEAVMVAIAILSLFAASLEWLL